MADTVPSDPPPIMLAPELWRIIFRKATYIPQPVAGIQSLINEWPLGMTDSDWEHYNLATATKLSLVWVCKSWYSIAIELLYEHIRLKTVDRMEKLLGVLIRAEQPEGSQATEEGSIENPDSVLATARIQQLPGWWTKILHVPGDKDKHCIDPLVNLTSRFPNLIVLNIMGTVESLRDHDRLGDMLRISCRNLQYLACFHYRNPPSSVPRDLEVVIQPYLSIPSLRYFHGALSPMSPSRNPDPERPSDIIIRHTHLTALSLRLYRVNDDTLNGLRLPSLRCVMLQGRPLNSSLSKFFHVHGPQLVSLGTDMSPDDLLGVQGSILDSCVTLHELLFTRPLISMRLPTTAYPSVVRLGIDVSLFLRQHYAPSVELGWFPNLRGVRVDVRLDGMDEDAVSFLVDFLPDLDGVLYEDVTGQIIRGGPEQVE